MRSNSTLVFGGQLSVIKNMIGNGGHLKGVDEEMPQRTHKRDKTH